MRVCNNHDRVSGVVAVKLPEVKIVIPRIEVEDINRLRGTRKVAIVS